MGLGHSNISALSLMRRRRPYVSTPPPRNGIPYAATVADYRVRVINAVWGQDTLPAAGATSVLPGLGPAHEGAASCDQVLFLIGYGISARGLHFKPSAAANGKAVILHHGEIGPSAVWTSYGMGVATTWLLQRGYNVLFLGTPNSDPNILSWSPVVLNDLSVAVINDHNDFEIFDNPTKSSVRGLRFFWEPAIRAVTYLEANGFTGKVFTAGLSSGGWLACVAAALDTRVRRSYPVAAILPPDMWRYSEAASNSIDYENRMNTRREIFAGGGLRGFCLMAAHSRKCLQTVVRDDVSGFNAQGREDAIAAWQKDINDRLSGAGVFVVRYDDSTTNHEISAATLAAIDADIQEVT